MKTNKILLLIVIFVGVTFLMTGCDNLFSSDSSSDTPDEQSVLLEDMELTRFDNIFQMNQYSLAFAIEEINEGTITFTSDSGDTYPKKIGFDSQEAKVNRLFTSPDINKLIVVIKNENGNAIDEFSIEI